MKRLLYLLVALVVTFALLCFTQGLAVAAIVAAAQTVAAVHLLAKNPHVFGTAYTPVPQTIAQTRSAEPNNIGTMFESTAMQQARMQDIFAMLEGENSRGSSAVVQVKNTLSQGGADKVSIPVVGAARGPGVRGDGTLEGSEDYLPEDSFMVRIDELCNALSWTQLRRSLSIWGGSHESIVSRELGPWLGWMKQTDALMALRNKAASTQVYRPRGVTRNLLLTSDAMSTSFIESTGPLATAIGVKPTNMRVDAAGANISNYLYYGPAPIMKSLNGDSAYREAANFAQNRGSNNTQFASGFVNWDGHSVLAHEHVEEDSFGPLGTPFLPRVLLGAAAAGTTLTLSGTDPIDVYGSGVAQNTLAAFDTRQSHWKPFAYFPGYDYLFTSYQDAVSDSTQYYAYLYDMSNGRFAFVRYQGSSNTGVKIAINRWTSDTSGADTATAFRRIGGVNGDGDTLGLDSADAAWGWGTVFNVGTTYIIPATKWGVPFGWSSVLGRGSLLRAYGQWKAKMIDNTRDYGRTKGKGISSIFGQDVPINALGKKNGYLLLEQAVDWAGFRLPPVTSAEVSGT